MHRPNAHQLTPGSRRPAVWSACAAIVLVLAACSPGPIGGSLTASQGGEPSLNPGQSLGVVASESASPSSAASASPTTSESGTLTGNWVGTWNIDPPYNGVAGGFTMEITQTGASFSGTVELTNSDCGDGTVSGSLSGTSVTFGWVTNKEPVQFTGVLDGTSSMSGTWSSVACSNPSISLTGTWAAQKKS
jgi:hypothetical protein